MVQIEMRPAAVSQIQSLIRGQTPDVGIRVYAQPGGGGCCGGGAGAVQFGLAFAKPRKDDLVVKRDGLTLLVDPASAPMVDGAVIDYIEGLEESGFQITNPKLPTPDEAGMTGGCGSCGSSSANGGGCGCGG